MRILRSVSLLALLGAALSAHALVLTNAHFDVTVVRPPSGSTLVSFFGTVTASSSGDRVSVAGLGAPFNANGRSLGFGDIAPIGAINDALASKGTYTGDLFFFSVDSNAELGLYDRYLGGGPVDFSLYSTDGIDASKNFSIDVVGSAPSVPGPMAALPFALMAIKRRKRA